MTDDFEVTGNGDVAFDDSNDISIVSDEQRQRQQVGAAVRDATDSVPNVTALTSEDLSRLEGSIRNTLSRQSDVDEVVNVTVETDGDGLDVTIDVVRTDTE